jgi:hypothetical protein
MSNTASMPVPLIARIKNILLTPKTEWPVIRSETSTIGSIYTGYLLILGLVPAIAGFIGMSLVGIGATGFGFRLPVMAGLVQAVVGYVLWLAMVYALALVINALAPTFGGQKDMLSAFKTAAYSMTAAWLGGIFSAMPTFAILGLIAALYSIYLLYTGLPVMMRCPEDKAVGYTAVTVLCGIVMGILTMALSAIFMPKPGAGGSLFGDAGSIAIKTPQGDVTLEQGKLDEMARKMEDAGKKMEQAGKSGDMKAMAEASAEIASAVGSVTGAGGGRKPMPAADLKAILPETVAGLARTAFEAQAGEVMGVHTSSASAEYGSGEQQISLSITDTGNFAGLASMASWMGVTVDRETQDGIERVYKQGNRTIRESVDKQSKEVEYEVILPNGVIIKAEASGVAPGVLKGMVDELPLAKLEAAK